MGSGNIGLWMFGLTAALLCLLAFVITASRRRQDKLFATTGQRATGRILDSGHDTDGMGDSYLWVKVQYDYDGPVTVKVPVNRRDQQRYRVGQRVGLTYAPSRSQLVRLDPPEWPVAKGS